MAQPYIIKKTEIHTNVRGAAAFRIRYKSYDLCGRPTKSTGLVVAPTLPVNDNTRKVMTWCHGTTGMGNVACPSAQPNPAGGFRTYYASGSTTQIDYGIPGLQGFIDEGWVVCATDYQGLGTPGIHQYTVNRTNAIDSVMIVRAARELEWYGAGPSFGAMGWSQGGGAAAAVAELTTDVDLADLTLVGTVAMSPAVPIVAANMPTGVDAALNGGDGLPDVHMFMNLAGLAAAFKDELELCDVFTPVGEKIFHENWKIAPVHRLSDLLWRAHLHEGPVMTRPINEERRSAWQNAMTLASATREKPVCPVLVAIDGQHDGIVVPVSWQEGYIKAARKLGGDVKCDKYDDDDHFSLPDSCVASARGWLSEQFGDFPVNDTTLK